MKTKVGVWSVHPQAVLSPSDSRQGAFTQHLSRYSETVIAALRAAGAICFLGPGGEWGVEETSREGQIRHAGRRRRYRRQDERPQLAREVRRHFEKQAAAERSCQAASHIGEHREDPETRRRLISYLLWPFPFP